MNVFIIPSWYPSAANPNIGIFTKEQAEALAAMFPEANFALSSWGSHEPDFLLWAREPLKNMGKLARFPLHKGSIKKLAPNLSEFYTPALSWSRRLFYGNIQKIIQVNEKHFLDFRASAGSVDLIHAHTAFPAGWIALALQKKYKLPYIITEHMTPFPFQTFLKGKNKLSPYIQEPYKNAFCNIAVSPQQAQTMARWDIPRLQYIPNASNELFFQPAAESRQPDPFTLLTLARFEPQKGIPYLLEAFKKLGEEHPEALLKIGGEGEEERLYKKMARELGIEGKIEWLGEINRKQVLKQLQQCSAFVLPSLHENLPLVLLEAIACGKPIIATRCGGPESIINARNGLLVEPANAEALSKALAHMYKNHHTYDVKEIRDDFYKKYSRPLVCRQIMALYKEAIQ